VVIEVGRTSVTLAAMLSQVVHVDFADATPELQLFSILTFAIGIKVLIHQKQIILHPYDWVFLHGGRCFVIRDHHA